MANSMGADFSSIYPFLDESPHDDSVDPAQTERAVHEQVRESSTMKILDIIALRRRVGTAEATRLAACASDLAGRFRVGGRLLTFGNGGSSTDAQDLARLFMWPGPDRQMLPAIALTNDIAAVTALSNDVGYEVAFARQIGALGRPEDIAVGLSTSGNSANLLRAFDQAKRMGMVTVGLAGNDGGKMSDLDSIDHLFVVPSSSVHRVQEAQTTVYHVLWELTADALGAITPSGGGLPAQTSSATYPVATDGIQEVRQRD
jgi:D-sedoheptulose 7-phosphate isomerase